MLRWILVFVLAVATVATGWAQSGSGSLMDQTTQAWNTSAAAEQNLSSASRIRNDLNTKFQVELEAIKRLKNSPRSWRRDRELKDKLSETDALARKLEVATADVRRATEQLAAARRKLIAAIDAEIASKPAGPRRTQLDQARAQVAPQTRKATRIVLPDMQIDPHADPEDLDQQAKAIKNAELELQNQIRGLEQQQKELERIAELRKQHNRARELDSREDTSPRKGSTPNGTRSGGAAEDTANPTAPGTGVHDGGFEMDATITLAEVVDPSTIDVLNKAQRSNDPKKRAEAARITRDAVQKKLGQLREKRKQVEDRAAQLRKGR